MDDQDDTPKGLDVSWSHLFLRDRRTDEERREAEARERRRRRGGNRNWWKKYPATAGERSGEGA